MSDAISGGWWGVGSLWELQESTSRNGMAAAAAAAEAAVVVAAVAAAQQQWAVSRAVSRAGACL
jgi:hypothetical protein